MFPASRSRSQTKRNGQVQDRGDIAIKHPNVEILPPYSALSRYIPILHEMWCWRRALGILWVARKVNKWVLDQIKPELSLEAKMLKLRLSCFGHIISREDSLEKTIIVRKVEGSTKRGRPNMKWSHRLEDRTFWRWLIHRVSICQK